MSTTDPGPATAAQPVPAAGAPAAARGWRRPVLLTSVAVVAVGAVATGTVLALRPGEPHRQAATAAGAAAPVTRPVVAAPVATLVGTDATGALPWQSPLAVQVSSGTLTAVTATAADGTALTGALTASGTWSSAGTLVPSTTYSVVATLRDQGGSSRSVPLTATTTAPTRTFSATVLPGDGAVVGVGQAVSVRLSVPVEDKASRAAIERRLTVTTVPAVAGSWRWTSSRELRYRGPGCGPPARRSRSRRRSTAPRPAPGSGAAPRGPRASPSATRSPAWSTTPRTR